MAPRLFKSKLSRFAPQFSGYNQHDSQVSEVNMSEIAFGFPLLSSGSGFTTL